MRLVGSLRCYGLRPLELWAEVFFLVLRNVLHILVEVVLLEERGVEHGGVAELHHLLLEQALLHIK